MADKNKIPDKKDQVRDNITPPPLPLLSSVLKEKEGYLDPKTLLNYIHEAQIKFAEANKLTQDEKVWLNDYMKNLGIAVAKSQELDALIKPRITLNHPEASFQEALNDQQKTFKTQQESIEPTPSTSSGPKISPIKPTGRVMTDEERAYFYKNNPLFIDQASSEPINSTFNNKAPRFASQFSNQFHPLNNFSRDSRKNLPQNDDYNSFQSSNNPIKIKANELVLMPSKFTGKKEDVISFIRQYEYGSIANGWNSSTMIQYLPMYLGDKQRSWYYSTCMRFLGNTNDWHQVKKTFLESYLGTQFWASLREKFFHVRQGESEPAVDFISKSYETLSMVFPSEGEDMYIEAIRRRLCLNLRRELIGRSFSSVMELLNICVDIESELSEINSAKKMVRFAEQTTNNHKSMVNNQLKPSIKNEDKDVTKERPKCTFCGKLGHLVDKCFLKNKTEKSAVILDDTEDSSSVESENEDDETIDIQESAEHPTLREFCSIVKASKNTEGLIASTSNSNASNIPLAKIKINGNEVMAMFDTGSERSLIDAQLARDLKLKIEGYKINLYGAGNTPMKILGRSQVNLEIILGWCKKSTDDAKVIISEDLVYPVIIGTDLLIPFKVEMSMAPPLKISFRGEKNGVRVVEPIVLPPRTENLISGVVGKANNNDLILVKPFNFKSNLIIANSIGMVKNNQINCLIINLSNEPSFVESDTQIASIEHLTTKNISNQNSKNCYSCSTKNINISEFGDYVKISSDLTNHQIKDLEILFSKKIDAFSINGSIGETNVVIHDIELEPNSVPHAERLRRRPLSYKLETSKQITKMLQEGIIEKCESPWAAAYVVVKKKNGELRICIDFRKLNLVTKKSSYPLPNIEDCLEPLTGNTFFSQLDLASGFWQIPISEKAKPLTSFRTEDGQFQFRRMPFGLCNAPASFQRLVNALFAGLKGIHLQVFIDDICLATKTWDEHISLLEKVLDILIKANLKLKAQKCSFGCRSVTFLGHVLDAQGLRPDPNKVKAISQLESPTKKEEVMRIFGLLNYYRRLIPNFSIIAEPISRLLRKKVEFHWGREQNEAFKTLKEKLLKEPILAHFNHHHPLCLKTDASIIGIAAILLQRQGEDWKIITCCSRNTSKAEKNYSITDLEGLAIVYAVTKLRNYILGKHFTIVTDHCALCVLKAKMPNSPRLRRWAVLLSEFNFSITYIKGKLHNDVDCLSRAPVDQSEDIYLEEKVLVCIPRIENSCVVLPLDIKKWKEASEADEEAKNHYVKARARQKGYKTMHGLLYYEDKLFVPPLFRKDILIEAHDENPSSHGGVKETLQRLSNYWWPALPKDTREYVKSCEICQKTKVERQKPAGSMFSFSAYFPFDIIAMDSLGPLPPSLSNKKHIFVAIDCFTRYVDAEASDDILATTCSKFIKRFIGKFGVPKTILSDNAPTFVNNEIRFLAEHYKFNHRFATARHHEGNGMVERVIQTIQHKMMAICHDPAHSVDWESELPDTILSINTSYHNAIGYTPYEMLFGLKHNQNSDIIQQPTEHDKFIEIRNQAVEKIRADAISNQSMSQLQSKTYFDIKHRKKDYEIGDLVLIEVGEGRRSKLQCLHFGPFQIIKRERDIYTLKNLSGKQESITRHVNNLIPYFVRYKENDIEEQLVENLDPPVDNNQNNANVTFDILNPTNEQPSNTCNYIHSHSPKPANYFKMLTRTLSLLIVLSTIMSSGSCQEENSKPIFPDENIFRPAPPIIWKQSQVSVSQSPTRYSLQIHFGHPCNKLSEFSNLIHADIQNAKLNCEQVFHNQITLRLNRIYKKQNPDIHIQPINKHPNNNVITPDAQLQQQQLQQQQLQPIQTPQQFPIMRNQNQDIRNKRQIAIPFICGLFICNIWRTFTQTVSSSQSIQELKGMTKQANQKIQELNNLENATTMELRAIHELDNIQTKLLQEHISATEHFVTGTTIISIVTADLIARMHLLGFYIDMIYTTAELKRLNLNYIILLFDTNLINDIDPDNIINESILFTVFTDNTFRLEFAGYRHDLQTKGYEITSFNHFGDLLSPNPSLYEYDGPKNLIYNSSSNCIKGIDEQFGKFISANCALRNYEDKRLSKWKIIAKGDPTLIEIHNKPKISWPWLYHYCYPKTILIKNRNYTCPPYVFQLNASEPWATEDYGEYSPNSIQVNYKQDYTVASNKDGTPIVHHVHFKNDSHFLLLSEAERKIRESLKNIENLKLTTNFAIPIVNREVSYKILFDITSILFAIFIVFKIISWIGIMRQVKKETRLAEERRRRRNANELTERVYERIGLNRI